MRHHPPVRSLGLFIAFSTLAAPAGAIEISGAGNGSLDQPRVNARLLVNGVPLEQEGSSAALIEELIRELGLDPGLFGLSTTNIEAFYDTGAGVGLFGGITASNFGIPKQPGVTFTDVGVGGEEGFEVSAPLTVQIGSTSPGFNPANPSHYTHTFNNHTVAIGEPPTGYETPNPSTDPFEQAIELLLGAQSDFNVLGMPYFAGKTVVIDARSLNAFARDSDAFLDFDFDPTNPPTGAVFALPQLYTHVYDHGSAPAFNPNNADNPGVPNPATADLTIQLNFADFSGLTHTDGPAGFTAPDLAHNPMIGPLPSQFNETSGDAGDEHPGVTITRGASSANGTWLFDTGAAASIISVAQANALGVFYLEAPGEGVDPTLVDENGVEVEQFELTLGGVGGQVTFAGFFLDSLSIPTESGEVLTFLDAPVLVADIGIPDSEGNTAFTLDGILGMNFLFASTFIDGVIDLGGAAELATIPGAFDWVVYDEVTNQLHLWYSQEIPEPTVALMLIAMAPLALRRRH